MSKATEQSMSELHGAVATVLTDVVSREEEVVEYDEDGEAVHTGKMEYSVSPAMMATAVKFLKDNSITCDIETNKNMDGLKQALAKKQKHSRLKDTGNAKSAVAELHAVS